MRPRLRPQRIVSITTDIVAHLITRGRDRHNDRGRHTTPAAPAQSQPFSYQFAWGGGGGSGAGSRFDEDTSVLPQLDIHPKIEVMGALITTVC